MVHRLLQIKSCWTPNAIDHKLQQTTIVGQLWSKDCKNTIPSKDKDKTDLFYLHLIISLSMLKNYEFNLQEIIKISNKDCYQKDASKISQMLLWRERYIFISTMLCLNKRCFEFIPWRTRQMTHISLQMKSSLWKQSFLASTIYEDKIFFAIAITSSSFLTFSCKTYTILLRF